MPPDAVDAGDLLHLEVADTLRVAAMVQEFRRHGHLVARLDPLRRPARGPWLAEVPTHNSDQRWVVVSLLLIPRFVSYSTKILHPDGEHKGSGIPPSDKQASAMRHGVVVARGSLQSHP